MTHYQIAIITNDADDEGEALKKTIQRRMGELGCDSRFVQFLDEHTASSRDRKAPTAAAYISLKEHPPRSLAIIELLSAGVLVVPVVADLHRYTSFVFTELEGINGLEVAANDPDCERPAAFLLEGLNLLRRTRRLFISYKRAETQSVAIQLYEALDQQGFDVFLDTHAVRPGEPFQEVLWHRLADTDVVVLLDSPDFLGSRWTLEELARANTTNVQVLQLLWPETTIQATTAFSRMWRLAKTDFVTADTMGYDARLKDDTLNNITVEVESLRARALAARYAYLVTEFITEATRLSLSPRIQPQRFIKLARKTGAIEAVVPAIGVPDALRYHEIEDEIGTHARSSGEIILLYDERGIRDKWLEHLGWLNQQKLRVRSLQVAESAAWLRTL